MKVTRFVGRMVSCALLVLLAACSGNSAEVQPPAIQYGEEVCDACGMLISDAKFAAASVDEDGTAHKFDDIGDLVTYYLQHDQAKVKAYFVHDYPSEKWLRAEQAFFVISPKIQTPMAHGIAAYADRAVAEAAAQKYAVKIRSFGEVRLLP